MRGWSVFLLVLAIGSCAATDRTRDGLDELWTEPRDLATRDLFHGSGGRALAPRKEAKYTLEERDTSGFSITYDVKDDQGTEWSVKIGPEAQTEVVSGRIVWAMGYHQPPTYYVQRWTYAGSDTAAVHGRFRRKVPGVKEGDVWDWERNPFVGTQPLRGLKVLMQVLNSTDLKADNNALYILSPPRDGLQRWFVVKDLGATLGETGVVNPRRGWIEGFERQGFIKGVENGKVNFEFRGRHARIFEDVTPADVVWMCERLGRLSDAQWRDAFRAGGYDPAIATRYIARIKEKIREGRALK
jgi:hypothetical protein